ncbi:hypothetical protein [Streptomyces umbrinus]
MFLRRWASLFGRLADVFSAGTLEETVRLDRGRRLHRCNLLCELL